ncbi:hypothetical protein WME98_35855 [Sorangium sp. So ce296]|uniref:hypothetical protein n=1 Tax=Sorangium sp. So ce296 TaxID=3133296 RepID=UPI003F5F81F4
MAPIQQLDKEELGAAAVEHMAPEPIGAVPRRGAGFGPGAALRLADVEVAARELAAAVIHLGTLGAATNVEAEVCQLGCGSTRGRAQE